MTQPATVCPYALTGSFFPPLTLLAPPVALFIHLLSKDGSGAYSLQGMLIALGLQVVSDLAGQRYDRQRKRCQPSGYQQLPVHVSSLSQRDNSTRSLTA